MKPIPGETPWRLKSSGLRNRVPTEWFECRRGIPTASEFDTVQATGRGGGESKTRRTYLYKLAGEILTGEQMYSYSNDHMERGKEMEAEARDMYIFLSDLEPGAGRVPPQRSEGLQPGQPYRQRWHVGDQDEARASPV